MAERDNSGTTKIEAAKQALGTVVDKLPAKAQIGMRVYGSSDFAESDPRACRDSQEVVPVGPVDKPALRRAIDRFEPVGWTPIAYALEQAAKDLGGDGPRTILLVSDGEETCDRDPVEVARRLRQQGIDLKIDVVGFDVAGSTRQQLARIAEVGGGIYYDASNADELADALDQSALRPFRPFTVQGTPVEGGQGPSAAPVLEPGQYTDSLGPSGDITGLKYYTLDVTPGATIRAAVTVRPKRSTAVTQVSVLDLSLYVPGRHEPCTWFRSADVSPGFEHPVVSGTVFLGPDGNSSASAVDGACLTSDRLVLEVAAGGADDRRTKSANPSLSPIELVIVEEPPVYTTRGLPAPANLADNQNRPVPPGRRLGKATGTPSFADAPTLTPGTWTDTIQPGEQLFYRMHVDWGQAPAVAFRLPAAGDKGWGSVDLAVFSPDRIPVALPLLPGASTGSLWSYDDGTGVHAGLAPVRYRNREDFSEAIYPMSIAGDYYFSVRMSDTSGGCWQAPVEINLAVAGAVEGEPNYVDPATDPPPTTESDGGSDGTEQAADQEDRSGSGDDGIALMAAVGATALGTILLGAAFVLFLARRPGRARNPR